MDCAKVQEMDKASKTVERISPMENNRLTKCIFNWDSTLCHNKWSPDIYKILSDCAYI